MNWLDIVIIAVLLVSAFFGMRMGLIGAAFTAVGVLIGALLAGQWADDVGSLFEDSLANDTLVTVVSYAIIIVGAVIVANIVVKFVRPLLSVLTLGLSSLIDKLGGIALGLVVGLAISASIITGLARLTYNFDLLTADEGLGAKAVEQITKLDERFARVADVKEGLETALTESALVPIFIDITTALPANALGYIPADFKVSLEILEQNIE